MRRLYEFIVEWILRFSGYITSLVIILIVLFLFYEAGGLFKNKEIEDGYVIAVNINNPVNELNAEQIKNVFDEEYTNWKQIGGKNEEIIVFRIEDIEHYFTKEEIGSSYENIDKCLDRLVTGNAGIIAFIPSQFISHNFNGKLLDDKNITFSEVFLGKEWYPTATPAPQFGFLPLIAGTLWVSFFAILFSLPFGLSVAIYMSEVANPRVRNFLKPLIELLNGIPSVVYGFFGLIVIVPLIQKLFNLPVGESGLAGSIVLGIMALPTIITISEDSLRNCPHAMREASLALGATKWQTIHHVVIPFSMSGIATAVALGIGRAIGETMAVLMVTGNAAIIPSTLLEPLRTIPATIAAELGEAPAGGVHYEALFMLGVVLFVITFIINSIVEFVTSGMSFNNKLKR